MAISKVSSKRAKQLREYKRVKEDYFYDNPLCEACGSTQIVLHHKKGRRGERLTDRMYFMTVCTPCHNLIHAHPEWAYENNYLIKG